MTYWLPAVYLVRFYFGMWSLRRPSPGDGRFVFVCFSFCFMKLRLFWLVYVCLSSNSINIHQYTVNKYIYIVFLNIFCTHDIFCVKLLCLHAFIEYFFWTIIAVGDETRCTFHIINCRWKKSCTTWDVKNCARLVLLMDCATFKLLDSGTRCSPQSIPEV